MELPCPTIGRRFCHKMRTQHLKCRRAKYQYCSFFKSGLTRLSVHISVLRNPKRKHNSTSKHNSKLKATNTAGLHHILFSSLNVVALTLIRSPIGITTVAIGATVTMEAPPGKSCGKTPEVVESSHTRQHPITQRHAKNLLVCHSPAAARRERFQRDGTRSPPPSK